MINIHEDTIAFDTKTPTFLAFDADGPCIGVWMGEGSIKGLQEFQRRVEEMVYGVGVPLNAIKIVGAAEIPGMMERELELSDEFEPDRLQAHIEDLEAKMMKLKKEEQATHDLVDIRFSLKRDTIGNKLARAMATRGDILAEEDSTDD